MIKLSQESFELLKYCLKIHRPELIPVIESKEESYSEEFYNELRDVVCDELMINAFEKDRPTKYGLRLENLIDEIGRLFM